MDFVSVKQNSKRVQTPLRIKKKTLNYNHHHVLFTFIKAKDKVYLKKKKRLDKKRWNG